MLESFSREFVDVINEAEQLKQDLNMMMENAVDISRSLVDELDAKVINTNPMSAVINEDNTNKIRIYELAKDLKVTSKQLILILGNLGYEYSSHMNTLDDNIVEIVKKSIKVEDDVDTKTLNSELIQNVLNENEAENEDSVNLEQLKKAHPYLAVRILHDQGYNIKEIARFLERGQGEVSLLLNLSKKSKAI